MTAYKAKAHLPRLLRAVEQGESVTITRHGKPVARWWSTRPSSAAGVFPTRRAQWRPQELFTLDPDPRRSST